MHKITRWLKVAVSVADKISIFLTLSRDLVERLEEIEKKNKQFELSQGRGAFDIERDILGQR